MNNKFKALIFALTIAILQLPLFLSKAYAETICTQVYGGGETCVTTNELRINKQFLMPDGSFYTDNLGINDVKFHPGFVTTFKIDVTNTGSNNISKVEVKDIFPQYVNFSSGPGTYDSNSRTLIYNLENLAPNETRTATLIGKTYDMKDLPGANGSTTCVVNQAIASIDGNTKAQDNAQFCIEKSEVVATTPSTGADPLNLLALIPAGLVGWFIRRTASTNK